jgi:hypothetical protein
VKFGADSDGRFHDLPLPIRSEDSTNCGLIAIWGDKLDKQSVITRLCVFMSKRERKKEKIKRKKDA